jgi:hypothetical protein
MIKERRTVIAINASPSISKGKKLISSILCEKYYPETHVVGPVEPNISTEATQISCTDPSNHCLHIDHTPFAAQEQSLEVPKH